jgi:hypothetical protein
MRMDKYLKRSRAFQRILNCQSSHIWTYLIWELWLYVTEMRKNKSKVCYDRLIVRSIELFIYIQTCVNVNAYQIKKIWTTVASLHCCNLIWGLANNNYSLYFLQFLMGTVAIYVCAIFSFPSYIVILYIVGPLSKLTETSFFCWRLHKYDLLQFVVMDHSTVIFQVTLPNFS